jgi:hypothetical protein
MDHGLMWGMLWAGLVMSFFPLAVGVGVAVAVLRHRRAGAAQRSGGAAPGSPRSSPRKRERWRR